MCLLFAVFEGSLKSEEQNEELDLVEKEYEPHKEENEEMLDDASVHKVHKVEIVEEEKSRKKEDW